MDPVKNFGFVTVSAGYDASATSIILSSGHGLLLPDPVVDGEYNLIWYDRTNYPNPADDPNVEIVRVTGPSGIGDTKTVLRNQESSGASSKNTASAVYKMYLGATAKTITDISDLTFPADQIEVSTIGTPTYDDMQDFMNLKSSGLIDGGTISDSGAGQIDVAAGTGIIKISDNVMAETKSFDWSLTENIAIIDLNVNYVYVDYNAASPVVAVTTDRSTIEEFRQFTLGRVYRSGTTVAIINSGTQITNHDRATHERLVMRGIQHGSGAAVSETGTRNIASTSGVLYLGNARLNTTARDTSAADTITQWYHTGGSWTSSDNAQIDNTYYDNGTNLTELTVNRYGVHWVFICGCSGVLKLVYGQENYTLVGAENASVPSALPDCIDNMTILAAKVIIQKSASSFISVVSAYETLFPVSSPSNHNDLGGIQGGTTDDYYHFTSAQHTDIINKITELDTALSVDHTYEGIIIDYTVGENVVFGDILYMKSDGKYWKSSSAVAFGAECPVTAMAVATILADASGKLLLSGTVRDDTWNFTTIGEVYGGVDVPTHTAPTTAGHTVQTIGISLDADRMIFNPDLTYIELS